MKIKVFIETPQKIGGPVNKWLAKVSVMDIHKVMAVAFPAYAEGLDDLLCLIFWLRE